MLRAGREPQLYAEAVNPVALGKARAKQYSLLRDAGPDCMLGDKVMSVQLHGDAVSTLSTHREVYSMFCRRSQDREL